MIPIIIFEGPDRTGKTTIANAVGKHYEVEPFMTNSKEAFANGTFGTDSTSIALFNYTIAKYAREASKLDSVTRPIIIYRSFLSEMVYSELLGRNTNIYYNFTTDLVLKECNATIVLCNNSREDNFQDDALSDDLIKRSKMLYNDKKNLVNTDILEIDTSDQDVEKYAEQIIAYIEKKRESY